MKKYIEIVKNWLQNNAWTIVGIVVVLFCIKSCQSCSRKNQLKWTEIKYEAEIDSLNTTLQYKDSVISELYDSITLLNTNIYYYNRQIEDLKIDKNFLKESNTTLNKNLKKSLDKNEKSY